MGSISGLGIGLSLVSGCILLAVAAEVCYLLWWKKKRVSHNETDDESSKSKELAQLFCWKKPPSLQTESSNNGDVGLDLDLDPEIVSRGEEGVEAELMRAHNLSGPPRFLFTIKEETKEDLESVDGRSRRGSRAASLSDLNPILSPLASPLSKSPTFLELESCNFNPLFESSTEFHFSGPRSSPPPKFNFLRDAEEKLMRKLKEQGLSHNKTADPRSLGPFHEMSDLKAANGSSVMVKGEMVEGSFLKFIVGKSREPLQYLQLPPQYHSSCAQVLPLDSSPPTEETLARPMDRGDGCGLVHV